MIFIDVWMVLLFPAILFPPRLSWEMTCANVQHMAVARRMIIFFMFLSFFFLGLVFVNLPAGRRWERADVSGAFLGSDVDKLDERRRVHGKFFPSIGRLLMEMWVVTRQSASVCN
jgi:hypothetical protein